MKLVAILVQVFPSLGGHGGHYTLVGLSPCWQPPAYMAWSPMTFPSLGVPLARSLRGISLPHVLSNEAMIGLTRGWLYYSIGRPLSEATIRVQSLYSIYYKSGSYRSHLSESIITYVIMPDHTTIPSALADVNRSVMARYHIPGV